MDACLNVYGILGLEEPDAGVIRTAGGVVSDDAIGSLLASQRLLGVLIHHLDCGMLTLGDDEAKAAVGAAAGLRPFALEGSPTLIATSAGRSRGADEPLVPHSDAVRSFDCEVAVSPCGRC